jgi:hypothetical protein
MRSSLLPNHILEKRMAPADWMALGRAAMTAAEATAKYAQRLERKEQTLFSAWLQLRGIPFVRCRTDKRSTIKVGYPDLTVLWDGRAVCIEFKAPCGRLSDEQKAMSADLARAHIPLFLAYSCVEGIETVCGRFGNEAGL